MSGAATPRGEEPGRLSGARGEFVSSLPRRLELLRSSLDALGQAPADSERLNGLLRRIHALGSSARVLGFASVAEALSEAEKGLRGAISGGRPLPLDDVARAFDLLPSLLAGAPGEGGGERQAFPISVLVFGPQGVADAIAEGDGVSVECERTEDSTRARELARIIGPDVAVIDADRRGARELVELFVNDPLIEPVPVLVIGSFATPEAATPFVELGASRVLPKPVSPEALRKSVDELRGLTTRPREARAPLGELTVTALSERMAEEFRRGLVEAVEGGSMSFPVSFGEGTDVMAAVWGAVARVRELVTLRSQGAVRFHPIGPEGAVPLAPWSGEERRAGERLPKVARGADGVSIHGRRIVVADDDPAVVWFMTSLLKAVGAEVIEAHDGRRALEITREIWPDAVISDVLMPKLDGFSLCHEIKRDVAVRDTPVILLSWKEDLLQRLRELGADADGYLRKEAAASAVVERVREVLRPRARVEQRIEAGGEVRGRLDGLTPRLLLELVCKHRKDARISVRDAVYLWELSLREGRLLSITRSSAQGDFARGPRVLPGLLGVTAGRFVIEPDATPTRAEFEGDLRAIIQEPIERARAALKAVTADSLVRIKGLTFEREAFDPYLACTPEPALGLLRRLFAAAEPRELVLTGQADPRLLENILSDLARRGVIVGVNREPSASLVPPAAHAAAPAAAPVTATPPADEADLDWDDDSTDDEVAPVAHARRSSRPPKKSERPAEAPEVEPSQASAEAKPAEAPENLTVKGSSGMPLSAEPTPAVDWTVGPLFAFGGDERGTLRGMGSLPAVQRRDEAKPEPSPAPPAEAPAPAPSAEPPRVTSPEPSPVAAKATPVASPEPPAVTSPEPSPAGAEGSDFATLLALTATPAPASAAPVEPSPAEPSAPPPAARTEALEAKPEALAAEPEAPVEPVAPASRQLAATESRQHSPFSEPPPAPSAPLTTDALLAALSPAPPAAESLDAEPSEPPPASSRPEPEFIDGSSVTSVPPSEPPPEEERESEEEPEPSAPPRKAKAKEAKPEAKEKADSAAKEPEKGSGLRALLGAVISFAVVFALVKFVVLRPAAEVTAPTAAPSAAAPIAPPVAAPKAATAAEPRIETMPIPSGFHTPAGNGWLQIEVPGPDALYVDGTIIGRGPSRRLALPPGKHQVKIGEGEGPDVKRYEVEITAATLTRLSLPAPAQAK